MSSYATLSGIEAHSDILEDQADGEATEALARALPLAGARRVLEVGCGSGRLCRVVARLADGASSVFGIDASRDHVEFARRAATNDRLPPTFAAMELAQVPAEWARSFDLVYCKYVLMYSTTTNRTRELLRAMACLLRPGGRLVCFEPDVNFGADRFPPPPEPLATVLAGIVDYYFRKGGVDWRCGIRMFHALRAEGFRDINVSVADGRSICGGEPAALADHACAHVDSLIEPILLERGESHLLATVAQQWRNYIRDPSAFIYNPILMASGRVAD
jgi:SAM-dependent methyltransferase